MIGASYGQSVDTVTRKLPQALWMLQRHKKPAAPRIQSHGAICVRASSHSSHALTELQTAWTGDRDQLFISGNSKSLTEVYLCAPQVPNP